MELLEGMVLAVAHRAVGTEQVLPIRNNREMVPHQVAISSSNVGLDLILTLRRNHFPGRILFSLILATAIRRIQQKLQLLLRTSWGGRERRLAVRSD